MLEVLIPFLLVGVTNNARGMRVGGKFIGGGGLAANKEANEVKRQFEKAREEFLKGNGDKGKMSELAKELQEKAPLAGKGKGKDVEPKMKMDPETGEISFDYTGMSKAQIKAFEAKLAKDSAKVQKEIDDLGFGETKKMNQMTLPESLEYAKQVVKKISPEAINDLDRRTARAMGEYLDSQNRLIDTLLVETGVPLARPALTPPAAQNLKALSGDAPKSKPSKPVSEMSFLEASAETAKKLKEFKERREASNAALNTAFTDAVKSGNAVVRTILEETGGLPGAKAPKTKKLKGGS